MSQFDGLNFLNNALRFRKIIDLMNGRIIPLPNLLATYYIYYSEGNTELY